MAQTFAVTTSDINLQWAKQLAVLVAVAGCFFIDSIFYSDKENVDWVSFIVVCGVFCFVF